MSPGLRLLPFHVVLWERGEHHGYTVVCKGEDSSFAVKRFWQPDSEDRARRLADALNAAWKEASSDE